MAEPLDQRILKVLGDRRIVASGESLSMQTIAEKLDAKAGWVSRALAALAKEGKVVRTKDGDDDGRGPFYGLVADEPEKATTTIEFDEPKEPASANVENVTYTVSPMNIVTPSRPTELKPVELLAAIENLAEMSGYEIHEGSITGPRITGEVVVVTARRKV